MGIYNPIKSYPFGQDSRIFLLSVDRPVDWPTVGFPTVVPSVDRPIDRGLETESRTLCQSTARSTSQRSDFRPLCHRSTARSTEDWIQRVEPLCRSTGSRSIEQTLWRSTRSIDRPSSLNGHARLCTSVDRTGRPTSASVDHPINQQKAVFHYICKRGKLTIKRV